ncbi:hypothetical protein ACLOJK_025606 [Asimina triloba]
MLRRWRVQILSTCENIHACGGSKSAIRVFPLPPHEREDTASYSRNPTAEISSPAPYPTPYDFHKTNGCDHSAFPPSPNCALYRNPPPTLQKPFPPFSIPPSAYLRMVRYDAEKKKNPEWLKILLQSKSASSCFDHRELRKNENKVFCIDCNRRICRHCLSSSHLRHKILQIRKYIYNEVINLHDLQKLLDCSKVQPYTVNGAKAVFLNPRPLSSRPLVNSNGGSFCKVCDRNLSDPNLYCSIACKVADLAGDGNERPGSLVVCRDSLIFTEFSEFNGSSEEEGLKVGESSESPNSSPESGTSSQSPSSSCETSPWFGCALKPRGKSHKRKGIPRRSPCEKAQNIDADISEETFCFVITNHFCRIGRLRFVVCCVRRLRSIPRRPYSLEGRVADRRSAKSRKLEEWGPRNR